MNRLKGLTPANLIEHFKQAKLQSESLLEFSVKLMEDNDALTVQMCEALWLLLDKNHDLSYANATNFGASYEYDGVALDPAKLKIVYNKGNKPLFVADNSWQPIETASLDGTVVDLFIDGMRVLDCSFRYPEYGKRDAKVWCYFNEIVDGMCQATIDDWEITHWMPKPKPPTE
jgi:hypothetical protein